MPGLAIEGIISSYANAKWFVAYETFNARIANREIPGTFMNVMNGISNLSSIWYKPIIMYSVGVIPYYSLVYCGFVYNFMLKFGKFLLTKPMICPAVIGP